MTQQLGLAAGHRRENGGGGRERREGGGGDRKDKDKSKEFYDNVYFDSSSDEGGSGGEGQGQGEGEGREKRRKQKSKVRKLTNDELFYDPHIDEDNERWVARQRMAYHNGKCVTLRVVASSPGLPRLFVAASDVKWVGLEDFGTSDYVR